jgi:hypothetical protein
MDIDAQVLAVLHRLESAISFWSRRRLLVQFTLVVLMGAPPDLFNNSGHKKKRRMLPPQESAGAATTSDEVNNDGSPGDDNNSLTDQISAAESIAKLSHGFCNPRIDNDEEWQIHGNLQLAERLVTLAMRHYPERFHKCLVVPCGSSGAKKVDRFLKHLVSCPRRRHKVAIIHSIQDLKMFIPVDELVTFAGGNAVVEKSAFAV